MISQTDLLWWCCLDRCQSLREIRSVCDIGLQEIAATHPANFAAALKRFVTLCGKSEIDMTDCRSSAELWRRLGREIVSLDLVGTDPSLIRFDLNIDQVPPRLAGHFDFVTNAGTTEHVFNQANCFKVLHDLTRVGGIMAHAVPSTGFETHGLFTYPLKFFWRLAHANDYECLDAWMSLDRVTKQPKPNVTEFLRDDARKFGKARSDEHHPIKFHRLNFDDYESGDSSLYIFLRKTSSAPFRIPADMPDERHEEAGRAGAPRSRWRWR